MTETMKKAHKAAPALAEIVRAALSARTPEQAAGANDMIALRLGTRHERFVADRAGNLALLTTPGDADQKSLEPKARQNRWHARTRRRPRPLRRRRRRGNARPA